MWDPKGQVAVVTGGASGIGFALCRALSAAGATVVVADRRGAAEAAAEVGGTGVLCDVTVEADVVSLVDGAIDAHGRVDLFCANAGIFFGEPVADPLAVVGAEMSDEGWDRIWRVNALSHVFAARALLPHWLDRGEGRLLVTASAAGLLTTIGNAPYTVTKHAAVAFAEWVSITYGDRGVTVTCLCPEGVRTPMLDALPGNFLEPGALDADVVAAAALDGVRQGRFLVMPHPHTGEYVVRKATDHERWLAGMRKLQASMGH
jgi:NAD(P)-dependent dehydrogenase (short-subunit alcohol dehydrogenase family)